MTIMSGLRLSGVCAIALLTLVGAKAPAQAQDFFSELFGGMSRGRMPEMSIPFAHEGPPMRRERPRYSAGSSGGSSGGSQAFCVRTCDGRYFPISAGDNKTATCNSFCPASETKVVYGSSIDSATTDAGKSYSDLPNAFKFRTELVAGCTCNGKDQIGLAPVKLEDDTTLRKGDIVAGADGLMSVGRSRDKRGAALNMSPVPASVSAKYERLPVVARE